MYSAALVWAGRALRAPAPCQGHHAPAPAPGAWSQMTRREEEEGAIVMSCAQRQQEGVRSHPGKVLTLSEELTVSRADLDTRDPPRDVMPREHNTLRET